MEKLLYIPNSYKQSHCNGERQPNCPYKTLLDCPHTCGQGYSPVGIDIPTEKDKPQSRRTIKRSKLEQ
jgi:hypothetical protein